MSTSNSQIKPDAPTNEAPKVRTLKEPPEIWDLVHETRAEFKPGSTFVAHLRALHPLVLAVLLIIVGGGGVFGFMKFRSWSESRTPAENSNVRTVQSPQPALPNRTESSPVQPTNNAPAVSKIDESKTAASSEKAEIKIPEPKNNVAAPATSSDNKVLAKPRPQNSTSAVGETVAARHKDRAQASNPAKANTSTVARPDNREAVKTSTAPISKSNKEQAANPPPTKKESDKALSPQLIAPAKASATPKPKVIAWP